MLKHKLRGTKSLGLNSNVSSALCLCMNVQTPRNTTSLLCCTTTIRKSMSTRLRLETWPTPAYYYHLVWSRLYKWIDQISWLLSERNAQKCGYFVLCLMIYSYIKDFVSDILVTIQWITVSNSLVSQLISQASTGKLQASDHNWCDHSLGWSKSGAHTRGRYLIGRDWCRGYWVTW